MGKIIVIGALTRSLVLFRRQMMMDMMHHGYEVIAVCPDYHEETINTLNSLGIKFMQSPMQRAGMNPFTDINYFIWLYRLFLKEKPDKVFGYTVKPLIYGGLASWFYGKSEFYPMISGLGFTWGKKSLPQRLLGFIINGLYKFCLNHASKVLFQNPDNLKAFTEMKLVDPNKCVVTNGSGVDLKQFSEAPLDFDKQFTFLLIARLIKEKGIVEYIEAIRTLKNEGLDFNAVLVGPYFDHPDALTEAVVEGWIKEGLIDFKGRQFDVGPFLNECHVVVLPSYYMEGVPKSLLEALATGRAIITTDRDGCRETVVEGENGYLVPAKNSAKLAVAMRKLLHDYELVERMGKASRALAEFKFDVKKVNHTILTAMKIKS